MPQWGGPSREKSVSTVTQSGKPKAVVAERLWTVHDVSAFLGVPVAGSTSGSTCGSGRRPTGWAGTFPTTRQRVRTWLNTQDAYGR
jgi:hypothetical protein